ncbi:hypothetical protein M407DRAFT_146381 [Tulasnella calospora MUT 4182]|uniref:Protein kinase domain-containing protein n=1 Tax=Tulasnella calospora MUT 4182 TaxID=1051891 RepID=A0A0C3Q7R7_9AGAM|nr:hypothetical protein M407DRAFT_146381 [Tulasnella calospora MUT 4182]
MYYQAPRDAKSLITSVVQPGRRVLKNQLLPELPGSLNDLKNVDYLGREFTEFMVGVWEQLDGSKTTVAVKRFRNINTDTDLFNMRIKREVVIWRDTNHPNIMLGT